MVSEQNIELLKARFLSLGFPSQIERELKLHLYFQPMQFTIKYRQEREGDVLNFFIFFQKENSLPDYNCRYYEATLRKKVEIPSIKVNDVSLKDLEQTMSSIAWNNLFSEGSMSTKHANSSQVEKLIEDVMDDLSKLSLTSDGAGVADLLKFKFWADTPLEGYCANFGSFKNKYEVSQRFYFFDEEEQITLDEAYRFLCHRWREKRLTAKKRDAGGTAPLNSGIQDEQKKNNRAAKKHRKRSGK